MLHELLRHPCICHDTGALETRVAAHDAALRARADAAEERVRVLEKALRPLAALAPYYEDEAGSSIVTVYVSPNGPHVKLLPRHAHEAAAALAKEKT
jgi:hypothetical protein